jgi:hypothetical protein
LRRRVRAAADPAGDRAAPGVCVGKQPASTPRVHLKYSRAEIAAFSAQVKDVPPADR